MHLSDSIAWLTRLGRRLSRSSTTKLHGQKLAVDHPALDGRTRELLHRGVWSADKVRQLEIKIEPNDRVLDVGAGTGLTALVAAAITGPENVTAIEADSRAVDVATDNFRRNTQTIELIYGAAMPAGGDGDVDFYQNHAFGHSSLFPRAGGLVPSVVPRVDLSQLIRRDRISALNIDVQGSELQLLSGISDYADVRLILLTVHEEVMGYDNSVMLFRHLFNCGFALDFPHARGRSIILVRRAF